VLANPRFTNHYPELIGAVMKDVYAVPAGPKARLYETIRKHMTLKEMWSVFKDLKAVSKI